jgi:hypothetical protein
MVLAFVIATYADKVVSDRSTNLAVAHALKAWAALSVLLHSYGMLSYHVLRHPKLRYQV